MRLTRGEGRSKNLACICNSIECFGMLRENTRICLEIFTVCHWNANRKSHEMVKDAITIYLERKKISETTSTPNKYCFWRNKFPEVGRRYLRTDHSHRAMGGGRPLRSLFYLMYGKDSAWFPLYTYIRFPRKSHILSAAIIYPAKLCDNTY